MKKADIKIGAVYLTSGYTPLRVVVQAIESMPARGSRMGPYRSAQRPSTPRVFGYYLDDPKHHDLGNRGLALTQIACEYAPNVEEAKKLMAEEDAARVSHKRGEIRYSAPGRYYVLDLFAQPPIYCHTLAEAKDRAETIAGTKLAWTRTDEPGGSRGLKVPTWTSREAGGAK